jgi:hypothetical protein
MVEVLNIASKDAPNASQPARPRDVEQMAKYSETANAKDNAASRTEFRAGYFRGREKQKATVIDVERGWNPPKPILYRIEHVPQHTWEATLVESFPLVE